VLSAAWTIAHRWKGRIFLALVDQGFASAANFLLTVLYATWLPLDDFGRYVVVWTVSVLVESFQVALILDSMPSIVSRFGQRNRQRIDTAGTWVVLIYGGLTSVLILAAIPLVALWTHEFTLPLICLAAVNPLQRLYVFFRRLCYIRDRQDTTAIASIANAAVLVAGAFTLFWLGALSVPLVVLLWGLANGAAILVIHLQGVAWFRRVKIAMIAWLIVQLWRSGRWLAGAAVGYWIANWGMFPIVAAIAGLEAAGILRALQNLFTPIIQFNAALNLAILPRVADKIVIAGERYARTFAIYATAGFTGIVIIYCGIVLAESKFILEVMYRKPEIITATNLLWPLALAMILDSARQGSSMSLLALGRTRIFFMSRLAGIIIFLGATVVLGRALGFEGVLWANVISHAVGTALILPDAFSIQDIHKHRGRALDDRPSEKHGTTVSTLST
jgi:O-antigen/teichoic acid export membrane protein